MPPLKLRNGIRKLSDGRSRSENFCYQNSLMNIWRVLPNVNEFFSERKYLEENLQEDESLYPISTEIHRILTEKVNSCEGLRNKLADIEGYQYFRDGNQEDINEFFRILVDALWQEYEFCISGQELLNNFEIKHIEKKFFVTPCDLCHYQPDDREDPQKNLTIFVTRIRSGTGLQTLVDNFYKKEDDRELACQCQPPVNRALKVKTVVQNGPEYLFIELRRAEHHQAQKSDKVVKIPEILKLPNGEKYNLKAVANHHSDVMNSGHYTALIVEGDNCFEVSDEKSSVVTKTSLSSKHNYTVIYSKIQSERLKVNQQKRSLENPVQLIEKRRLAEISFDEKNTKNSTKDGDKIIESRSEKVQCRNCKKSYVQLFPHLKTKLECQKGYDLADEKKIYHAYKHAGQ